MADTSVVLNLCRVGHEPLLRTLFGRVLVPTEVASEFSRLAGIAPRFSGLAFPGWIEVVKHLAIRQVQPGRIHSST